MRFSYPTSIRVVFLQVHWAVGLSLGCMLWTPAARSQESFLRGDVNGDGKVDTEDLFSLSRLHASPPPGHQEAADVNDDGEVDVHDLQYLAEWLYANGPAPPPSFRASGTGPTLLDDDGDGGPQPLRPADVEATLARVNALLATARERGWLTGTEYLELIRLFPDEEGGWRMTGYEPDTRWHPLHRDDARRRRRAAAWRERIREWNEQRKAEKRRRLEELEVPQCREAHGDDGHSNCECYRLEARAEYDDGHIAITSTDPQNPTRISRAGLVRLMGRANAHRGVYTFRDGRDCCTWTHATRYVQIAISPPSGAGQDPKYTGPPCPRPGWRPDDWYLWHEYDAWLTLSWTPEHYSVRFATIIGPFEADSKREAWVSEEISRLRGGLRRGVGKIEMKVNGEVCATVYYEAQE